MALIMRLTGANFSEVLEAAKDAVLRDGVVIYPTDTVYGIGGNAHSRKVVARIRSMKGSPEAAPFSVILSDLPMIREYCEVDEWQEEVMRKYLPGPYTFVLRERKALPVSQNGKLGVRIPESDFAHRLAEAAGVPIVTTSANMRGELPPVSVGEVRKELLDAADLAVDAGTTKHRGASAVVDLVEKRILRKGVGRINL